MPDGDTPTAGQAATEPGFRGDVEIEQHDSTYIRELTKGQGPARITGKAR